MGGRGGSGGVFGAGKSGAARVKSLQIPAFIGSDKQVAWAKDVLEAPYRALEQNAKIMLNQAKKLDGGGKNWGSRERKEAAAMKSAQERYIKSVAELPKSMKASDIIDKQNALRNVAYNILADEYKKRGFKRYETPKLW